MDETLDKLGETIAGALPGSVTSHSVVLGELTINAVAGDIVKVATFLRDDERCQFLSLLDVTAVDWPGREHRFDVVYHLLSPKQNLRIRVKLDDVPANVFIARIPEEIELRLIRPQNGAVRTDPVEADGRCLDEIAQYGLAPARCLELSIQGVVGNNPRTI